MRIVVAGVLVAILSGCVERAFVFFPTAYPAGNWDPSDLEFEDVWLDTEDGVKLHGWYATTPTPRGFLLFAHGNAGNLSHRADVVKLLNEELNLSVLIFDYRGYGRSEGKPSVSGVLKDGYAAQQWLRRREDIDADQIILLGRSLGASVMTHLASKHGAQALILEGAFSSLVDVADHAYPWLPTKLFLRQDIKADELITQYHGPLLQSHGTGDTIIPIELGRKVFEAANEPKQFIALPGLDHNDPPSSNYYQKMDRFFTSVFGE
jgi:fermentation-respiration switch protein FrsA (DUF1100 family)